MKQAKWFGLIFTLFLSLLLFPHSASAEEKNVLLVYDSLNIAGEKTNDVDAVQRLLTSYGIIVHTVSDYDYIPRQLLLDKYEAVITMVNWSEKGITNKEFLADRLVYQGKKLHIGEKLEEDEISLFTGTFKHLSHRQYTLKDENSHFSQHLEYKDQSVVLSETSGESIGILETQELEPEQYPFGVIENGQAYLPFFSKKGAVFLKSAELIGKWLGVTSPSAPVLAISDFNPMRDMGLAEELQEKLVALSLPYAISSTSVNVNNTYLPFRLFTDRLRAFQETGVVFLEVPAVNSVNLNDNHALSQLMEQQVSLLVEREVYPVGITAPGYWNQDIQYQTDGLSFASSVILYENPELEKVFYRSQTNVSKNFGIAFYDLSYDYLENIEWNESGTNEQYRFPMPTTLSFSFPETKKQLTTLIQKVEESSIFFYKTGTNNYTLTLKTTTQDIQFKNHRLYLNGQLVNGLTEIKNTEVPEAEFQGLFARFFNVTDGVLIGIVLFTLAVLTILFLLGRKNYREKYIKQKGEKQ